MITPQSRLPLTLIRSGSSIIALGIFVGCLVPITTYPRLGISAHIHFLLEGIMILSAGVLLHVAPINHTNPQKATRPHRLADTLDPWQEKLIYWAFALSWPLLIAEVFNAWWGTVGTLPTVAEAAGVVGRARWWQEFVMGITHYVAVPQVAVWPIIVYKLFSECEIFAEG